MGAGMGMLLPYPAPQFERLIQNIWSILSDLPLHRIHQCGDKQG